MITAIATDSNEDGWTWEDYVNAQGYWNLRLAIDFRKSLSLIGRH